MNKKNIIGIALIAVAAGLAAFACSDAVAAVERLVGKAVWYLPYAALVSGVSMLRLRRA